LTCRLQQLHVHNLASLPGQTLLSPETLYPTLVTVAFVVAWLIRPGRVTAGLLFGWALLHLVGAVLTVLPLPFLPSRQSSRSGTTRIMSSTRSPSFR